jgi:lipoate-protein ligase A
MNLCRLYVDPPLDGAWNMAVDEALLNQAADEGVASLRFYQWREPTLSLGYFQRYDDREQHPPSRCAATVRRLSGGGALVHDRELTYALCLPANHALSRQAHALYELVHTALIRALAQLGIVAVLHGASFASAPDAAVDQSFLCFERRTAADVVLVPTSAGNAPAKIAGSAQRRRRGAVLQHGGVLLDASAHAPELAGIRRLSGKLLAADELSCSWTSHLREAFDWRLERDETSALARRPGFAALTARYSSDNWLHRR